MNTKYSRIIKLLKEVHGFYYRECHVILHIALWNPVVDYEGILEEYKMDNWIDFIRFSRTLGRKQSSQ
ncbi:hypothetical protein [Geminocystis sp. NIES-3709]|uniref:hypothetical protein n=1 Tax=Geminocystis sp. NIES-3709 TaxID=1617448 RepID=UPI0011876FC8|nr:hypothetical protein [Geminocystis sp. NIES-3709]